MLLLRISKLGWLTFHGPRLVPWTPFAGEVLRRQSWKVRPDVPGHFKYTRGFLEAASGQCRGNLPVPYVVAAKPRLRTGCQGYYSGATDKYSVPDRHPLPLEVVHRFNRFIG